MPPEFLPPAPASAPSPVESPEPEPVATAPEVTAPEVTTAPPAWNQPYPSIAPGEPAPRARVREPGPDPVPPEPEPVPVPGPAPDPTPPEPEPAPAPPEPAPSPLPPEPAPAPTPPKPPVPGPVPDPEPGPGPEPGPVPTALAGRIVPGPPAPGGTVPEHHLDPLVPSEPHAPAIEVAPTPPPIAPGWARSAPDATVRDGDEPEPDAETTSESETEPPAATEAAAPEQGSTSDLLLGAVAPAVTSPDATPDGDADAPPAVTTEPILIEGEPDESSRRRGRLVRFGVGALVALVSLVVLVLVILDSTSNDAGTPTTAQPVPTGPNATVEAPRLEPLSLPTILMPSGMVVARTWELTGEDGTELVATVDISNPTEETKSEQVLEVIPKSLAADVSQVRFEGATPVVVRADPIVRFDVTLGPGQRTRIGYRITVPADGADPDRLTEWQSARETEQQAFDAILNLTVPKGQIKPGG
jgi:hypothetical protein